MEKLTMDKLTIEKVTPDMIMRPEDMPKTRLVTYTTKCPLCDNETERVEEVPRYDTFVTLTSVICDECKSLWARLKKKYTEGEG